MFKSKLTPAQWAEARRARAEGASFAALAARYGLRAQTICKRARAEGWLRPRPADASPAPAPRGTVRAASASAALARRALARRLYNLIDIRVRLLEQHLQRRLTEDGEGGGLMPLDGERELFAALIDNINQVTELESDADRDPGGSERHNRGGRGDAGTETSEEDAFRRKMADRVAKLSLPS
jgi:hypothetical protein